MPKTYHRYLIQLPRTVQKPFRCKHCGGVWFAKGTEYGKLWCEKCQRDILPPNQCILTELADAKTV